MRYGATVKSVDDSAAKKVPGFIKAVTLDDKTGSTTGWVVAVANTYANARKAADALKITYDGGPNAKLSSESLLNEAKRLQGLRRFRAVLRQGRRYGGGLRDGGEGAGGGIHHQHQHPRAAGADERHRASCKGDIWHIYSGNQFATRSGAIAAGAAGVDPKFVVMHQMWLGGGFGRRLDADMMVPGGAGGEGRRQAGQGHLLARKRHDHGLSRVR